MVLVLRYSAYLKGIREVTLSGGTGSNDGGMGLLSALGYSFLDKNGELLTPITGNIGKVFEIVNPDNEITFDNIHLINDVINPLLGQYGATKVFGPQKGAHDEIGDRIEADMLTIQNK